MITLSFLAEWALRSTLLILCGAGLLKALRIKDPSIVLAAWTAMLCGSLAIPALYPALPNLPLGVMRVVYPTSDTTSIANDAAAPVSVPAITSQTGSTQRPAAQRFDWTQAALVLYALVAGVLLLRLIIGLAMTMRLRRQSLATGQETQGIEIRESDRIACPIALGIMQPVILLPSDWRDWDVTTLDAVLAHERSHIGRRDPLVQLLSAVHRALLWYSPASWYLHSQIVRVAEEASDDAAVAAIHDRAGYAELLLGFMRRGVRGAHWQGVPMARYGQPEERVQRILDATSLTRGVTRAGIAAILALGTPLTYIAAAARSQSAATATQTPDKTLTFEVASVKPFVPPPESGGGRKGGRGPSGPGTADPERIHYTAIRLKDLVMTAYNVKEFQIVGPPWLESTDETTRFAIDAKLPPGTTKEQLRVMLQNLLAERFKLATHRETRERAKYSLTVAKNGPKMKEAAPYVSPPEGETIPRGGRGRSIDAYGFPVWQEPPEGGTWRFFINGRARLGAQRATMQDLADELTTWQLRTPVTNDTGLTAKYDFVLTFSVPDWHGQMIELPDGMGRLDPSVASEPLPDLFSAMQSQLGLKLEPKKGPVEVIVIDHIERAPTAN